MNNTRFVAGDIAGGERRIPFNDKLVIGILTLLIGYASWVRGGTSSGYQMPMLYMGLLAFIALFVSVSRRKQLGRLFKDPVVYIGGAFLILLCVQWLNSGRTLLYDYSKAQWIYTPPPVPGLPSAIDKTEAMEMLMWFFPAAMVIICVRHGLSSRKSIRVLFAALLVNACPLAVLGVVQFMSGTTSLYWRYPLTCHFFASFGYPNHGAAFFFLGFCIALALCCHAIVRQRASHLRIFLLVTSLLLTLTATHLSLSRGMVLLSWTTSGIAGIYLVIFHLGRLSPAVRVNLAAGAIGVAALGYYAVATLAEAKLDDELRTLTVRSHLERDFDARYWQIQTAVEIWKDNQWFGVGGWGYRYLSAMYLDKKHWDYLKIGGKANVHNDVVQFLAEFGAAGLGLLVATTAILLWPILSTSWRRSQGFILFAVVGVFSVFLYSMVDIPFRCPAVLFTWAAMLTGASQYLRLSAQ